MVPQDMLFFANETKRVLVLTCVFHLCNWRKADKPKVIMKGLHEKWFV